MRHLGENVHSSVDKGAAVYNHAFLSGRMREMGAVGAQCGKGITTGSEIEGPLIWVAVRNTKVVSYATAIPIRSA